MYDFFQEILGGSFGLKEQAENSNIPKGSITTAADFPTLAEVRNGWTYTAKANVTDNDATKTNTGQLFIAGQEFYWFDGEWVILGDDRLWSDDGSNLSPVDTRGVDIPSGQTYKINGSPHAHAHADTTGKQGGTTNEYYHLTQSENARVVADVGYMQAKVASTANLTLSGEQTIDGSACVSGDIVLAKDQTLAQENGVYVVAAGAWSRAPFADSAAKLLSSHVIVSQGSINGGSIFRCMRQYTFNLGTDTIRYKSLSDTHDNFSQSFYISTTGSDLTGDGTQANPFFSVHRVLRELKPSKIKHNTYIYCEDGSYDFSALGDFVIDTKNFGNSTLYILPVSGITTRWTTLDAGGNFDTNAGCVHTDTGKTWTTDQWVGKFVRISSVKTGSLPTESATTPAYTYRCIPILRNGADWVECAYTNNNNENWNAYTIVEPKVKFSFGANSVYLAGPIQFYSIEVSQTGGYLTQPSSSTYHASTDDLSFFNCSWTYSGADNIFPTLSKSSLIASFLSSTKVCYLNRSDSSAFVCSYSSTVQAKAGYLRYAKNSVFMDTGTNKGGLTAMSATPEGKEPYLNLVGKNKFINFKDVLNLSIASKTGVVAFNVANTSYCGVEFDTVTNFLNCKSKMVRVASDYAVTFGSEPTNRLTFDGSTAATEYFNQRYGLNALLIAPSAYNIIKHDSFENLDVDTGTEVVDSFADTACKAVRWDFMVSNSDGTAVRCGSINAVWDAAADTINDSDEYGIVEVGDTSGLTFTVTIAANLVTLSAVAASDNWIVKVQRYPIG